MSHVHICSFEAADVSELRGKYLTYENVKRRVLKAGRFSCFEACTTQKHAQIFTDLCQDPEIETMHAPEFPQFAYPWTGVRLKAGIRRTA